MSGYRADMLAKWSTDRLEAKVAELEAKRVKDARRTSPRPYYAQMGVEQTIRSLGIYAAALRDRRAGILPDESQRKDIAS